MVSGASSISGAVQKIVCAAVAAEAGQPFLTQSVETYARAAEDNIATNFFEDPYTPFAIAPALKDGVKMTMLRTVKEKPGYSFQISIPYAAFPPMPSLALRDLWLMVDVFGAAPQGKKMGAFSTTAPGRKWGEPATFNHVRLEHPVEVEVTPCEYPLASDLGDGEQQLSFVYPVPEGAKEGERVLIDHVVVVANPRNKYSSEPGGASPEADVRKFFWRVSAGAAGCFGHLSGGRGGNCAGYL